MNNFGNGQNNIIGSGGGNGVNSPGKGTEDIKKIIIEGLKDAPIEYKDNIPYMKQYQVNDSYKVLLRKDFDIFNHGDMNHWNFEIQTIGGRTVYDIHIYMDAQGNILPITNNDIYIPRKSPFN